MQNGLYIANRHSTSRAPFSELEQILLNAGTGGGKCSRISLAFRASDELQRRLAQVCEEQVVIADSYFTSTRVSCMEVIKTSWNKFLR